MARMGENARVASGGNGILTAEATPETARRAWPQWLALGIAMITVAVVAVVWDAGGARLLLGALGLFLVGRGALLLRAGRSRVLDRPTARQARSLGTAALAWGGAVLVVAIASAQLAAGVLLFAAPVALLAVGGALRSRGGRAARRGGSALLVWAALVIGLLVVTFLAQGWDRAAEVATVVTALAVAGLGMPLLVAALRMRTIAAAPVPATPVPATPAGCGGCACGAGGCGS
jgi:hypothetical protein